MSVGSDETIAPFRRKLPEKLVFIFVFAFALALNIPVCEPGVIAQFARWSLVRALTEHDRKLSRVRKLQPVAAIGSFWNPRMST